ncbi:MAG: hypothetical protein AB1938_16540 [Myxococcota bacterium]
MHRRRNALLVATLALSLVALFSQRSFAQDDPPEVPPTAPSVPTAGASEVTVGVFVNQIHEFSLKDNSFTADFYVWFRWKNPALKPYETFSVVDGRVDSKTEPVVKDLPDGSKHAFTRVVATITRFFDTRAYPLDNHQLAIIIEEENDETHVVRYVADAVNSAASPNILLPGWKFQRLSTEAGEAAYHSNFGDTSLPTGNESKYARLTTAVAFTRIGLTFYVKLFFGLWACVLLATLAFFIRPSDVDPRFGVGVGALFGAIASQYVVASALPDSNVITLADRMHLVAFFFIILSVAQSTLSLWLWEEERIAASKRLDRLFRLASPVLYVAITVYITASA